MNLLADYKDKLDFLEKENMKLKSVLSNELNIKQQIREEHEKEIQELMKYFETLEEEKLEVEYKLNQNKEEIDDLQNQLNNKNKQIDDLCSEKRGMEEELFTLQDKAKKTKELEKRIEEVEDINNMIIDEKVKISGEKRSMVLRVSQLEREKEVIQGKLIAFKKYNDLLFGKKNILGKIIV
jgi:chromosome segregation ATPase